MLSMYPLAAHCALGIDISYARFVVGSWIIYALVGYFATKFAEGNRVQVAMVAGAILGATDCTLGWAISWLRGPGKVDGGLTPTRWFVAAVFVTATASALAALAGLVARSMNHGSHG